MYEDKTPRAIKEQLLARAGAAGWSVGEGTMADLLAGPVAAEIAQVYEGLSALVSMAWVDETSGGYLDMAANALGLYRKEGAWAVATIRLEGNAGTLVPRGTVFLTGDGLAFDLDGDVTLGADGAGTGTVTAQGPGGAYNIEDEELVRMYVNLPGLTRFRSERASGGVDLESDGALFARYDARRKRPSTSGNKYHYEQWALEVPGVGLAKVLPLVSGPGTVGVVLADETGAPVAEPVRAATAQHIDSQRPIGAMVMVTAAEGVAITVAATVKLDSTTAVERVREILVSNLNTYLRGLAQTWVTATGAYTLLYNRVAWLLLDIDGVVDYTELMVNGTTGNVVLGTGQVPVLGEVTLDGASGTAAAPASAG